MYTTLYNISTQTNYTVFFQNCTQHAFCHNTNCFLQHSYTIVQLLSTFHTNVTNFVQHFRQLYNTLNINTKPHYTRLHHYTTLLPHCTHITLYTTSHTIHTHLWIWRYKLFKILQTSTHLANLAKQYTITQLYYIWAALCTMFTVKKSSFAQMRTTNIALYTKLYNTFQRSTHYNTFHVYKVSTRHIKIFTNSI